MALEPADMAALFTYFSGAWQFSRDIHGPQDVLQAQASGQCSFTPAGPAHLHYAEQGQLHMLPLRPGARPIGFTRLFDYRFDADGVAVFFADGERAGQPYQRYVLDGHLLGPAADHICGPDCYNATYVFESATQFLMETFIRGPQKHTRVVTRCTRA